MKGKPIQPAVKSTGFRVSEEGLEQARNDVVTALQANRAGPIHPVRFDWLYGSNPDGPAVIWTIRKEETGELAGFTVALPRRMLVDGQQYTCWNCADFSVFPKFRTLGIAVKLRRAAREGVDAGRVSFLYAHPNARMELVHQKVGHFPVGTMVRYAKVLRSRPYLEQTLPTRLLPAIASGPVDMLLRLRSPEWRRMAKNKSMATTSPSFDERFDRLFGEASGDHRVVGVRDARYLTWRYSDNPLYRTTAIVAERDARLRGYAIFAVDDEEVANLKDVFPANDRGLVADLIAELIRQCRSLGLRSISAVTLDKNPVLDVLSKFGFARRGEVSRMYGYAPERSPLRDIVKEHANWFVTVGDRDV